MSLFGKILDKLGFGSARAEAAPIPPVKAPPANPAAIPRAATTPPVAAGTPAAPVAIPVVDVVAKLEALAAANPQKLNWRVSIVDLLKLLGLESSFTARKELATELKCPPAAMSDSASMNMWLHKTVLQKLADNGGNIPKDLLD